MASVRPEKFAKALLKTRRRIKTIDLQEGFGVPQNGSQSRFAPDLGAGLAGNSSETIACVKFIFEETFPVNATGQPVVGTLHEKRSIFK